MGGVCISFRIAAGWTASDYIGSLGRVYLAGTGLEAIHLHCMRLRKPIYSNLADLETEYKTSAGSYYNHPTLGHLSPIINYHHYPHFERICLTAE
jgi:hypothetical protein